MPATITIRNCAVITQTTNIKVTAAQGETPHL
jgi:hypothetical protein